ncbi:MAG: hypothetical protein QXJ68_06300 [Methanocellales archaeon]
MAEIPKPLSSGNAALIKPCVTAKLMGEVSLHLLEESNLFSASLIF